MSLASLEVVTNKLRRLPAARLAKGGSMTDILERLADLHKQAVQGDGLQIYGVMDIAYDATEEIKRLRFQIETLEQLLSAYITAQRPKAVKKG